MKLRLPLGLLLAVLSTFNLSQAASVTWTSSSSGKWSDGTNWSTAAMPSDSDDVIFGAAATVLADTTSNATISLGGVVTFDTFVDSTAQNVTFSGIISGSGGIIKTGAGTLTLSGVNTHTGAITVNEGMLVSTGNEIIKSASSIEIKSGAVLSLGNASNLWDVDIANFTKNLKGDGDVHLYMAAGASVRMKVQFGNDFLGDVYVKTGVLAICGDANNTYYNFGKGRFIMEDGTTLYGNSISSATVEFDKDIQVNGTLSINIVSGSATFAGKITGNSSSLIKHASADNVRYTGDWSEYGGLYEVAAGRLLFDIGEGNVGLFKGMTATGNGVRLISGTYIMGGDGITGNTAFRIGTDSTGKAEWRDLVGDAVLGGTEDFSMNISSQGIYFCANGSRLTVNTSKWESTGFTNSGITITIGSSMVTTGNKNSGVDYGGQLVVEGAGTLILNASNTLVNGLVLKGGTVVAGHANALGGNSVAVSVQEDTTIQTSIVGVGMGTLAIDSGKTLTVSGSGVFNRNTALSDTAFNGNMKITDTATFAFTNINKGGYTLSLIKSGSTIDIASGATLALTATSSTASPYLYIQGDVTGTGTVACTFGGGTKVYGMNLGSEFEGTVRLKAGILSLSTATSTDNNVAYNLNVGKGTIVFEDGTGFRVRNINGGSNSVRAWEFSAPMHFEGASDWSMFGNTNSTISSKMTGVNTTYVKLQDGPALITYTGDWSGFNGTYENTTGKSLFDTSSVINLKGLVSDANGVHIVKGDLVLGTGGLTGATALTVGIGESGLQGVEQTAGNATLATSEASLTTGSEIVLEDDSVLTVRADKYDVATNSYTATGTTITLNGVLSGNGGVTKKGAGELILNGANTYKGTTVLKEGKLTVGSAFAGAAEFVLSSTSGAILNMTNVLSTGQIITADTSNTTGSVADLTVDGGTLKHSGTSGSFGGFTVLNIASLTIGSSKVVFHIDSNVAAESGTYKLVNLDTEIDGSYLSSGELDSSLYSFSGINTDGARYTTVIKATDSDKALSLVISGESGDLNWDTGNGTWKTYAVGDPVVWDLQNSPSTGGAHFFNGDTVNFVDVTPGGTTEHQIILSGSLEPNIINVTAETEKYTFTGAGTISGSGKLIKTGAGILEINTTNTFSGGTDIGAGQVILQSTGALGTGVVNITGGTLTINTTGTIASSITMSGGAIEFISSGLDSATSITTSGGTIKWLDSNTNDISSKVTTTTGTSLTLDIGGNDVTLNTALATSGVNYTKEGSGTLTLTQLGALRGALTINAGTVSITGGGEGTSGYLHGSVLIKNGGTLYTKSGTMNSAGGTESVNAVTIESGGTWEMASGDQHVRDMAITLKGGRLNLSGGNLDMMGTTSNIHVTEADATIIGASTSREIRLRQNDTEFKVDAGLTLTVSAVLSYRNQNDNAEQNLLKTGAGLMIVTRNNDYGTNASNTNNRGVGETKIQEGTLQIGNGGTTGSLGKGKATISGGASLVYNRSGATTISNVLEGVGTVQFKGVDTSQYTLSGNNTLSGIIDIINGTVTLNHASALGSGSTVNIKTGTTLDYAAISATGAVTLKAEDGSRLATINGATHDLYITAGTVTAAGDITVNNLQIQNDALLSSSSGDIKANILTINTVDSRIIAAGNITVTNGGQFIINSTNSETGLGNALVQGNGAVSVNGLFLLNLDSNLGAGQHTYYLFGGTSYSAIEAELKFASGKEYLASFYSLDTDDFTTNGTVIINRLNETPEFVDLDDIAALGSTYTPPEADSFLGAKETLTPSGAAATKDNPVNFNVSYDIGTIGAYKLSTGLGWINIQTQLTGDNKLLISEYRPADGTTISDHGVLLSNNANNLTGDIENNGGQLLLDASMGSGIANGDAINLLGTGAVTIGGNNATLELRPGGAGDTGDYTLANNITLVDGATLTQTSGSTELSGIIRVASSTASIQNTISQDLIFTGSLVTENNGVMVLKGANSSATTYGNIVAEGATGNIETLQLTDQAHFLLKNGADITVDNLKYTSGADLNIAEDSTLHLTAVSGVADNRLILDGGTLHATGNLTLGGTGNVTLRVLNPGMSLFALSAYNTIEVDSGSTVTLNGLAAADGDFTKTGAGTLILAGNYTPYTGTITIGQGPATLTASTYGGNLVVGVDGTAAELSVNPIITINGLLTTNAGATTNVGSGSTLAGGLILNGGTYTGGSDITIQGTTLQIGEGSTATFGRDTVIKSNLTELAIGPNATVSFGRGSIIAGTITNGITLEAGSTYSGTLNLRANEMTLKSGSTFLIAQEHLDLYTAGNIGITGTGTINVEQGTTIQLDNGLDLTNAPLFPSGVLTLIETTGTLTIGGANVIADQDYTDYLGENNYAWYSFSLLGGNKQLNLEIRQDVRFQDYAQTANQWAMVPIANNLATNSNNYQDELQQLGKALAMSTTGNAHNNLSQLAHSTSSLASGHIAQVEGLRRHTFDLLNRAVQEKTGIDRLNYEKHHSSIWVNGLGGTYQINGDNNATGNTTNIWGGTLGTSTSVGENTVIGLSFTYTNSDTRLDKSMGKAEADTYYLDLFTRYRKDNWNIIGVVTGGMYSMDIERNLSLTGFNSTTQASPDGKQLMAMLQVGYEYTVSDDQNSILEPFLIATGGYSEIDGYTENGAGTAGLVVDSQNQTLCSAGVGLRFAREYFTDRDTITKGRFEARAIILQDLAEVEGKVDASFIGDPASPFQVESKTPGRTAIIVGLGILHPLSQNLSLFANADGEFRSDANGVGGTVGVRYSF